MTYFEFRDKYMGQWIDWDGAYGCQCWDLAQVYFTECLGLPSWVLSGCGLVSNMLYPPKRNDLDTYFYEVPITEMCPGDVCIWDWGHIALLDNWDGTRCWYFSQNPGAAHLEAIDGNGMHAFRLKPQEPPKPTPQITPNVEKDIYKDQIEVIAEKLRVRTIPSLEGEIIGLATPGYYDYFEIVDAEGYNWYRIADNQWVAYNAEWENIYPATPKIEYKQMQILEKKDGYVLVDLGQVWIKE